MRREDALRDDPVALRWMRALIGAVHGASAPFDMVARMLGGTPLEGMAQDEFEIREGRVA